MKQIIILEVLSGIPGKAKCFTRKKAVEAEAYFRELIKENEKYVAIKTSEGDIEDCWSEGHYERHNYEVYFINED